MIFNIVSRNLVSVLCRFRTNSMRDRKKRCLRFFYKTIPIYEPLSDSKGSFTNVSTKSLKVFLYFFHKNNLSLVLRFLNEKLYITLLFIRFFLSRILPHVQNPRRVRFTLYLCSSSAAFRKFQKIHSILQRKRSLL